MVAGDGTRDDVAVRRRGLPDAPRALIYPLRMEVPRLRVLVCDDDPGVRGTVRVALDGMEIVEAVDGHSALQHVVARPFDVVVLDVMMPVMDGFATLQALRRRSPVPDIPVIMLSARRSEADHLNAFRAGADAYMTKPFDIDVLLETVLDVWRRTPQERARVREEELGRAELLLQIEHGFE